MQDGTFPIGCVALLVQLQEDHEHGFLQASLYSSETPVGLVGSWWAPLGWRPWLDRRRAARAYSRTSACVARVVSKESTAASSSLSAAVSTPGCMTQMLKCMPINVCHNKMIARSGRRRQHQGHRPHTGRQSYRTLSSQCAEGSKTSKSRVASLCKGAWVLAVG